MKAIDDDIEAKIGDRHSDQHVMDELGNAFPPVDNLFDEELDIEDDVPAEPEAGAPEADDYTPEAFNKYLSAEVMLPVGVGGEMKTGTVMRRAKDDDGRPLGVAHANPIADTRVYKVQMQDGSTESYSANIIAESMYSMLDSEGRKYALIDEIQEHKKDASATLPSDGMYKGKNGRMYKKRTTRG